MDFRLVWRVRQLEKEEKYVLGSDCWCRPGIELQAGNYDRAYEKHRTTIEYGNFFFMIASLVLPTKPTEFVPTLHNAKTRLNAGNLVELHLM